MPRPNRFFKSPCPGRIDIKHDLKKIIIIMIHNNSVYKKGPAPLVRFFRFGPRWNYSSVQQKECVFSFHKKRLEAHPVYTLVYCRGQWYLRRSNVFCITSNAFCITSNAFCITSNAFCITSNASCITSNASCITSNASCITSNASCITSNAF